MVVAGKARGSLERSLAFCSSGSVISGIVSMAFRMFQAEIGTEILETSTGHPVDGKKRKSPPIVATSVTSP